MSLLQASVCRAECDYLLGRSWPRVFFFEHVDRPMNRIDMLFSINGLLILKGCTHSHSFAGRRDKMLINYLLFCFYS